MYAEVHRVKTEVFVSANPEVSFVNVTINTRDSGARQVCIVVMHKLI